MNNQNDLLHFAKFLLFSFIVGTCNQNHCPEPLLK
jgi:hypothetical protein